MSLAGSLFRLPVLLGLTGLALLPLLPVFSAALPALAPLERLANFWLELHCHRDPARTPHLLGVPLAVCARCSGIYFGLGLGAAVRRPTLAARALRLWVLGAAALMLLDIVLELGGGHGAWPALRLLTGALLAYPVGVALERRTVCWANEVHELATSKVAAWGAARAAPTRKGLERSGCKLIGVLGGWCETPAVQIGGAAA